MIEFNELISVIKIIATTAIVFVWVARYENIKKEFIHYNYPSWFRDLVGILKISFCVMLHSTNTNIVYMGSIGMLILMLGAVYTHIRVKSNFRQYIASVSMVLITFLILYSNFNSWNYNTLKYSLIILN